MPRQKKRFSLNRKSAGCIRAKRARDRETAEEREKRVERARIQSSYMRERRVEMEGKMLQRLETYLQSQYIKEDEEDDDEDEEKELVRINVPKSELLKFEFPLYVKSTRNDRPFKTEDVTVETDEKFEPDVTCRPSFDIELNNAAKNHVPSDSSESTSELHTCSIVVKDEIVDETYERVEVQECFVKVEDDAFDEMEQEIEFDECSDDAESCSGVTNNVFYDESNYDANFVAPQENIVQTGAVFECDVCLKRYPSKTRLKLHSLIHDLYPEFKYAFECRLCNTRFPRKHILQNHMLTHERNPLVVHLKCDVCEAEFSRSRDWYRHLLIHLRTDRNLKFLYKCRLCGEGFIQLSKLKRHNFGHRQSKRSLTKLVEQDEFGDFESTRDSPYSFRPDHDFESLFTCDACKERFTQKRSLKKHIFTHHLYPLGYMFECEIKTGIDDESSVTIGSGIPG